jgi:hypothetical protein
MCAPNPPPAPDYAGAAQAQGASNVQTAKTQGQLNNPNVVSPYGTQTVTFGEQPFDTAKYLAANPDVANDPYYSQHPLEHWTAYGQAQNRQGGPAADQPTITQKFSPEQQALLDQQTRTKGLIGGLGEQGARGLQGVVGKAADFSGLPTTGSYDATRKSVIDAMMGRANEDYTKATDQKNSDLIAAGITPGTKAYQDAQQMIERSRNDARQQAEIAGGNAASQAYGVDAARRQSALQEYLAQRQTPLNEVSALMSGSQVSNPFTTPGYAQNTQVGQTPTYAAQNAAGAYGTDVYNQQVAQQNALTGGLFKLGSAAIGAYSDRRLKSHIVRIGTHPLGIGVYEYDIDGRHEVGVMADEVLTVRPEAVTVGEDGYQRVYYGMLT